MDPADIQPGDVLVQDGESGISSAELLILAVGIPTASSWDGTLGVMYSFLDEIPFKVYGPWILRPGASIDWTKKGESEVT